MFRGNGGVTFARCHLPCVPGSRLRGRDTGVAWEAGSGRGTRRPDWLAICLWDRADVWVEQASSIRFLFHFFSPFLFVCPSLRMSVRVCKLPCVIWCVFYSVQRLTLRLTRVPWGLIVSHMEQVNREQVHVIMRGCLVIHVQQADRQGQFDDGESLFHVSRT